MRRIPSRVELYCLYWDEYKTLEEIAEIFGVTRQAIYQQMKVKKIPRRPANHHKVKKINGKIHKLCKGPTHEKPTWVPVARFGRLKSSGKPRAMCTPCDNKRKGSDTRLPVEPFRIALEEIIRRVGCAEAARVCGINHYTVYMISHNKTHRINRATARKILTSLGELRSNDVVRHKKSIRHGAYLRGRVEKTPKDRLDYYKPTGDTDLEFRRNYRHTHIEQEREADRARQARKKAGLTAA